MLHTLKVTHQYVFFTNESSCLGTIYHNGKAKIMVIDNVKVEKEYRKQGIGTNMIQYVINFAKRQGVDSVELLVNEDNEIAKKLYSKLGFKKSNKEHHRLLLKEF
jgi:ribosomal protein S18 acetylase RimI-like enzyme